ncbi:MAG: K(+)-transporting ATPase subunit C [Solirubrobacterales bacterium]
MRRDLVTSLIAVVLMTVLFGIAYPLALTGVAQVVFPGRANGSKVTENGTVVGSSLIAQKFTRNGRPDRRYFQPRPSQTGYDPSVTYFSNLGPNSLAEKQKVRLRLAGYLKLNRPYDPGLTGAGVPVDAITQSASGVDPQISEANAQIQAHRIAAVRRLPLSRVTSLISDHTDGRFLGLFGEPGVNVLELNLALDREAPG